MKKVQDSRAEAFIRDMLSDLLGENFTLTAHSFAPEPEDFEDIVQRELSFRNCVNNALLLIASRQCPACSTAYIDGYESAFLGSYALALWFMKFDEDNWFSHDRVLEKTRAYLQPDLPWNTRQELRLFKGLCAQGLLTEAISPPDLPIIINHEERTITILSGELRD